MSKILFLGDLFFDYDNIPIDIEEISNYIKRNNYKCILNLEGTLFQSKHKIKKRGPNLCQSTKIIEVLKKLNVIGVTLANNHIYDYGEEGLLKTIEILRKNNIKYCGAGKNISESLKPMEIIYDEKKIVIYNFGWRIEETVNAQKKKSGSAPRKEKKILNTIKEKSENEIIIPIFHWGFEYNIYPLPIDICLAHKLIEQKNVDMIIGHHSHCIQSFELYKETPIYYSLGNFYFSSRRDSFSNIEYPEGIKDKSDYGLGVVYDLDNKNVEKEILLFYDGKETKILEDSKQKENLLIDITDMNKNSKEYIGIIKKTGKNKNPVLDNKNALGYLKIYIIHIFIFIKKYLGLLPGIRNIKKYIKKRKDL